ncbi:MAG: transposase [Marinilabiliales bacterium]|nr:MAG: transposase [Marinilabiliales bacterium]
MSYTTIWIHAVWSTKYRRPYLKNDIRENVFKHIKEYANEKGIQIDCVNGYEDHIHCLIFLKRKQNIADVVKAIKGESTFWINKNCEMNEKFRWQNDYYAISVGQRELKYVRKYIRDQVKHHEHKSVDDEIKILIPTPV